MGKELFGDFMNHLVEEQRKFREEHKELLKLMSKFREIYGTYNDSLKAVNSSKEIPPVMNTAGIKLPFSSQSSLTKIEGILPSRTDES